MFRSSLLRLTQSSEPMSRRSRFWLPLVLFPLVACTGSPQAIAEGNHAGEHSGEHSGEHRSEHTTEQASDAAMPHGDSHGKQGHALLEVPADQPVPTVALIVHPDPGQGWNLEVQVENFAFAPQNIGRSSRSTEGHAHIYVNGEKISRLYGAWYHLPSLPPGRHTLKVNLNTNDHATLTHQGEEIAATAIIEVLETQDN